MKSSFKETIEFVGLNYKVELFKIILTVLVVASANIAAYIFIEQKYVFVIIGFLSLLFLFYVFSKYGMKKKEILLLRDSEFVSLLSYFNIFINNNNNVYHTFELLLPYCSNYLKDIVEKFLRMIDVDKSVTPYIEFAYNFTSPAIESVMLSIYQMVDQGESSAQMNQFIILFKELSKTQQKELIDKKEKSLDSMNTWPLIGAGAVTMILTFSILSIVGELTNVI